MPAEVAPPPQGQAPATAAAAATKATAAAEAEAIALADWFAALGRPRPGEAFGPLVLRAARLRLGAPYGVPPWDGGEERLVYSARMFDCVTLVESALAVARCAWAGRPDASCFAAELQAGRYRGGRLDGWNSRLHYFEDWLADNAARGRLQPLTAALGGEPRQQPVDFISRHPARFGPMQDPAAAAAMAATEARLSASAVAVLPRAQVPAAASSLADGDIVTIVGNVPGVRALHVGLAARGTDGRVTLLHASSLYGRTMVATDDLAGYLALSPRRIGVLLDRPLPPP